MLHVQVLIFTFALLIYQIRASGLVWSGLLLICPIDLGTINVE